MAEEAKTTEMAAATETAVSEFRPIESQEAFDAAIKDRIERAQNKIRKEYEGFADYKAKAEMSVNLDLLNLRRLLMRRLKTALKERRTKSARNMRDLLIIRQKQKPTIPKWQSLPNP